MGDPCPVCGGDCKPTTDSDVPERYPFVPAEGRKPSAEQGASPGTRAGRRRKRVEDRSRETIDENRS